MLNNYKVSIIVPFYGDQDEVVIKTLESLQKLNFSKVNLIFIDNGATSTVSKKLENYNITLIKSKKNLGVCGGRNLGIKNLHGDEDFVIFFDSDQVADKDMVNELIKPMLENPKVGITTPKIYYHPDFIDSSKPKKYENDKNLKNSSKIVWSAGTDINLFSGQIIFFGGIDREELNKEREVSVAPGVICVRIELLKKIEKFNEIYQSVYEDTDFCFRAKKFGYKTLYVPTAVAWHKIYLDPKGSEKKLLTRMYFIGRNRIIFMKNYSPYILIFYFFIPLYLIYYLFISIRNYQIKPFSNFFRGTLEGIFFY